MRKGWMEGEREGEKERGRGREKSIEDGKGRTEGGRKKREGWRN